MSRGLELSNPAHEFEALENVAVATPLLTLETFDPFVAHPDVIKLTAVDSGLFPLIVSGGENTNVPVTLVQVTLPVATASFVWLEFELQPAVNMVMRPSGMRNANPHLCIMDITLFPLVDVLALLGLGATLAAPPNLCVGCRL